MRKTTHGLSVVIALLLSSSLSAQIASYTFDNDLSSVTGQVDLDLVSFPGVTADLTLASDSIGGEPAQAAALTDGTALTLHHGLASNGGGAFVNDYTLVMDVKFPEVDQWISLYQTNDSTNEAGELDLRDANDGDWFVNPDNGIGISGNYGGMIAADTWYRLVLRVDSGTGNFTCFIDGVQVQQNEGSVSVDGRFALYGADTADFDYVLIFADESGDPGAPSEMGAVVINNLALIGRALDDETIGALGGPTAGQIQVPAIGIEVPATNVFGFAALLLFAAATGWVVLRRRAAAAV